jgi:hypothetical protein
MEREPMMEGKVGEEGPLKIAEESELSSSDGDMAYILSQ